ncbi:glycosyltransferase family 2 protein [Candidatus Uhrbacteria bacterium]|nr:glycosyltransferase family 2 protein [Candidatus Uhrbacteria bacterium]
MRHNRCGIIIVSWNVAQLLERCLNSVFEHCRDVDFKIVVVDNCSSDQSVASAKRIQRANPKGRLSIIANASNRGFASAVMTGYERLVKDRRGSDPVLLLNPDVELHADVLPSLLGRFHQSDRVAIIGPTLFDEQGMIQRSVMRLPTVTSTILLALKLHHVFPWLPAVRRYFAMDHDYTQPSLVEQVQGAFFLVRPECWRELEGLDPHYFIWYEEVDFCKRALDAGWEVLYQPTAGIVHHGGKSFEQAARSDKQAYFYQSAMYYIAKHKGFLGWFLLWCMKPLSSAINLFARFFRSPRKLWVISSSL